MGSQAVEAVPERGAGGSQRIGPRLVVASSHKITRVFRYVPLDWNDEFPRLSSMEETSVTAVTDYLCHADRVNAWVGVYVSLVTAAGGSPMVRVQDPLNGISEICAKELPAVLEELADALRREMGGG